jgi:hypothetical protein
MDERGREGMQRGANWCIGLKTYGLGNAEGSNQGWFPGGIGLEPGYNEGP